MSPQQAVTTLFKTAMLLTAVLALHTGTVLAQDTGSADNTNTVQTLSGQTMAVPAPATTGNAALKTCQARKAVLTGYVQCLHKLLPGAAIGASCTVDNPNCKSGRVAYSLKDAWAACNMNDLYKTTTTSGDSGGVVNPPCCKAGDSGGTVYPGGSDCTPGTPGYNPNATDCNVPVSSQ